MTAVRIMIVDDDSNMTLELKQLLKEMGYKVAGTAVSGEEALEKVGGILPDLIIMDIQLTYKGLDGIETATEIYRQHNIPSVYLTGHADDETIKRVKESGAFGYILKPFKAEEFLTALEIALSRCKAEKILGIGQSDLQNVVMKIADGIIVTDPTGKVLFSNPAADVFFGKAPGTWAGSMAGFTVPAESTEMTVGEGDSRKVLEVLVVEIHWQQKEATLMSLRDMTERRTAEEKFRRTQRLSSVGMLVGGVVHDFNNYLGIMKGYCEILQEADPTKKNQIVEEMKKVNDRTSGLARQLLAFSRKETRTPVLCNLNDIVLGIEKMLRILICTKLVDLQLTLENDLWEARVDAGHLEQVLVNLAVNGRDAMPDGGRISIETKNVRFNEPFGKDGRLLKGDYAMIMVRDTGTGMPPEVLARISEPFFTTKGEDKGTGLGLSTSFGIIRQLGGDIHVESQLGTGSVFEIYLPRAEKNDLPQK